MLSLCGLSTACLLARLTPSTSHQVNPRQNYAKWANKRRVSCWRGINQSSTDKRDATQSGNSLADCAAAAAGVGAGIDRGTSPRAPHLRPASLALQSKWTQNRRRQRRRRWLWWRTWRLRWRARLVGVTALHLLPMSLTLLSNMM